MERTVVLLLLWIYFGTIILNFIILEIIWCFYAVVQNLSRNKNKHGWMMSVDLLFVWGCQELYDSGVGGFNNVLIQPTPGGQPLPVYCSYINSVIMTHHKSHPFSFNRTWDEYVNGFKEDKYSVWIGLETLHQITKHIPHQVLTILIGMQYNHNTWWGLSAEYADFKVGNRSTHYAITYSSYIPRTSNILGDTLNGLNGSSFSTYDRDNDGNANINCALQYAGGWWFNGLNGCSKNSITSFFTCPSHNCGQMEIKNFPGHENLHAQEKIDLVSLHMNKENGWKK